mgnify:CR=1 FL=1
MAQKKTTIQKKTTSKKVSMPKDPSFITEYDRYLFGTGTDYERIVRRLLYVLTTVLFIYILIREVV